MIYVLNYYGVTGRKVYTYTTESPEHFADVLAAGVLDEWTIRLSEHTKDRVTVEVRP